jgi:hypothetical protein
VDDHEEFAGLLANQLPGFFPISNVAPAPENAHAAAFLALNEGAGLDMCVWAWEKLLDGAARRLHADAGQRHRRAQRHDDRRRKRPTRCKRVWPSGSSRRRTAQQ